MKRKEKQGKQQQSIAEQAQEALDQAVGEAYNRVKGMQPSGSLSEKDIAPRLFDHIHTKTKIPLLHMVCRGASIPDRNIEKFLRFYVDTHKNSDTGQTIKGDINIPNPEGYNVFYLCTNDAVSSKNKRNVEEWKGVLSALKTHGADVNQKTPDSDITPLYYAISKEGKESKDNERSYAIAKYLIEGLKADVNIPCGVNQRTALHQAAIARAGRKIELLVRNKASLIAQDSNGFTALHLLLANIVQKDGNRISSLAEAIQPFDLKELRVRVKDLAGENGEVLLIKDKQGNFPVHYLSYLHATTEAEQECIAGLFEWMVERMMKTPEGKEALLSKDSAGQDVGEYFNKRENTRARDHYLGILTQLAKGNGEGKGSKGKKEGRSISSEKAKQEEEETKSVPAGKGKAARGEAVAEVKEPAPQIKMEEKVHTKALLVNKTIFKTIIEMDNKLLTHEKEGKLPIEDAVDIIKQAYYDKAIGNSNNQKEITGCVETIKYMMEMLATHKELISSERLEKVNNYAVAHLPAAVVEELGGHYKSLKSKDRSLNTSLSFTHKASQEVAPSPQLDVLAGSGGKEEKVPFSLEFSPIPVDKSLGEKALSSIDSFHSSGIVSMSEHKENGNEEILVALKEHINCLEGEETEVQWECDKENGYSYTSRSSLGNELSKGIVALPALRGITITYNKIEKEHALNESAVFYEDFIVTVKGITSVEDVKKLGEALDAQIEKIVKGDKSPSSVPRSRPRLQDRDVALGVSLVDAGANSPSAPVPASKRERGNGENKQEENGQWAKRVRVGNREEREDGLPKLRRSNAQIWTGRVDEDGAKPEINSVDR